MAKDTFKPFVVLCGDEDLYLDREIQRIKSGSRPVTLLDAGSIKLTDAQLVTHCTAYSDEPFTVLLDNAQALKGDKALKQYLSERSAADRTVILVAVVRGTKIPAVWEAAIQAGGKKVVKPSKLKPWDDAAHLKFITQEATTAGVVIRDSASKFLLKCTGNDLYRISGEIKKLAILAGPSGEITSEHIRSVVVASLQVSVFKIVDAVFSKNTTSALSIFTHYYSAEGDGGLVPLVGAMISKIEKLVQIRSLQDSGTSEQDIASLMDMKIYPLKALLAMTGKHSLPALVKGMRALCRLDEDVKRFSLSKRTLVEMAMLAISQ